MFRKKQNRKITSAVFILSWLALLHFQSAAQCGGTYFKQHSTTLVPINGRVSQTVDMTGDGVPDLLGTIVDPQTDNRTQVYVLPADGNGGFGAPFSFTPPNNIVGLVAGDFDNDNLKDLWLRFEFPTPNFRVYKNNGNGTFTQFQSVSFQGASGLYLLDINNDGKGDLISYASFSSMTRYHLGNGDGTFQNAVNLVGNFTISPADFNADGLIDFLSNSDLLINQGGGVFTTAANALGLTSADTVRDVRDYNGDGKADVASNTRVPPYKVSLFINQGNNSFQRTDYPINPNNLPGFWSGFLRPGNFGGDASPDLIYSTDSLNKTIVFINDGAGNFASQTYDYKINANFIGDLTGDAKSDSIVVSEGNSSFTSSKFFNEMTVTIQKNVCQRVGQTRFVDFTHSGRTDFSYWTPDTGWWGYVSGTNSSGPRVYLPFGSGSAGDLPTPGDFDGDGATDIAVYRNSTGTWWINRSSDGQSAAVQFGLPGDKPVVGDYDGDTISDIAVWRPSDGNWYILFMGTQNYTIAHWGASGDKPVPEDYDGDQKTDLAVFRPSTGVWYYLKSTDLNFGAVQFGLGTDKPVPADYDGDGKADFAVYRESNNVFHLLRSYNLGYSSYLLGASGDILQPGDFTGDLVTDFAYYRPSTQSWGIMFRAPSVNFGANNVIPTSSMLRIE